MITIYYRIGVKWNVYAYEIFTFFLHVLLAKHGKLSEFELDMRVQIRIRNQTQPKHDSLFEFKFDSKLKVW